jgi:PKD repeat protein
LAPGYNTLRWTLKGYNCEAYDEIRVRSADEPIAGFNMPSDTGCEPFEVQFDNITIGKADYVWDFGDGAQSTLRSPSHLYDKAGVYKVALTAIGKYRTDKVEKTVTVLPSPEASFTVSSAQLYVPNAEAHFFNETDKAVSYYWDFGDGHASTEKDPVHTYYEDGEYDITYIVVDENGCADTLKYENYIHVGKGSFIVFPTAFTPNVNQELDGIYSPEERRLDIFYPIWRNVDTYKLEIFNQWGNMVFSTDDVLQGWNGYYLNQPAAQGVYVFKAEGRFRDGTAFREGGSVLLIR